MSDFNTLATDNLIPESQKLPERSNLIILIIDDDFASARMLQHLVKAICYKAIIVTKSEDALDIFQNNPGIELILMDIAMPKINGYDVTRQIRKFNTDVVIIAQTSFANRIDIEMAIEAGCNDHISKPIHKDQLISMIRKHF